MKIAITAKGNDLDSEVDMRFGRCEHFVIVDEETMALESVVNEGAMASGGAGPQASQAIADRGVKVLLTGNIGPNAFHALNASDIRVFIGASGSVREAMEKYKKGELAEAGSPSVGSHSGIR